MHSRRRNTNTRYKSRKFYCKRSSPFAYFSPFFFWFSPRLRLRLTRILKCTGGTVPAPRIGPGISTGAHPLLTARTQRSPSPARTRRVHRVPPPRALVHVENPSARPRALPHVTIGARGSESQTSVGLTWHLHLPQPCQTSSSRLSPTYSRSPLVPTTGSC